METGLSAKAIYLAANPQFPCAGAFSFQNPIDTHQSHCDARSGPMAEPR